ncbi:MAG: EAL domain-containing protein [Pseudomonadota bacterium]
MTNSFVAVYADNRHPDTAVPATFRRQGVEHFSDTLASNESAISSVRLPGVPGLEISVKEADQRLADKIAAMARSDAPVSLEEHQFEDGRFIARTMSPSIANSEGCVSCHNDILGAEIYEIGDVMGAFVVESDLTNQTVKNLVYSLAVFVVTAFLITLFVMRERGRMSEVVEGLKARVLLEREKAEAEANAHFHARHDTLTKLSNRAVFMERIDRAMASGARDDMIIALIDLDDFKIVNDSMGHDAGDALLVALGARLAAIAEAAGGLAARLGGDEFALFCRASGGGARSEQSLERVILERASARVDHGGLDIRPSISVGLARFAAAATSEELLKAADAALYRAKELGKGRVQWFDASIRVRMERRAQLALALPDALAKGAVRAVFQPQVALDSGRLMGFEALARWEHEGEPVPPTEFVSIAEERGLVAELDLHVLRSALAFAAGATSDTALPVAISANLSAKTLLAPRLSAAILRMLAEARWDPRRLTLEITETRMIKNLDHAIAALRPLRERGVRISLDDFGTGFSSLSYLRHLPVDELKIDKSFVTGIEHDEESFAVLKGVLDLALGLGKSVVVEGIETARQLEMIRAFEVSVGQGFYIAKPLEAVEAAALTKTAQTRLIDPRPYEVDVAS